MNKKREKNQFTKIRNERVIISDSIGIKRIIRECYEKLPTNNWIINTKKPDAQKHTTKLSHKE
jgi:hypothetical protein